MKVHLYIDKETAVRAGSSEYGDKFVKIDVSMLTKEQREKLLQFPSYSRNNSTADFDLSVTPKTDLIPLYTKIRKKVAVASPDVVPALLDEFMKADGEYAVAVEHKKEQEIKGILEKEPGEFLVRGGDLKWRIVINHRQDPRIAAFIAEQVEPLRLRANQEDEQRKQERLAEKEREKREQEEKLQREEDQIAAWVRDHGTDSQVERYREGVLPLEEVWRGMRNLAFSPLALFPRYKRMQGDDVCLCKAVKFKVGELEGLGEREYEKAKEMKARLPEATFTYRKHVGFCRCCARERIVKHSALVNLQYGEFTFSREYAL